MFENVYISQDNHEIMQIDFPDTHTQILEVYYETHNTVTFNFMGK